MTNPTTVVGIRPDRSEPLRGQPLLGSGGPALVVGAGDQDEGCPAVGVTAPVQNVALHRGDSRLVGPHPDVASGAGDDEPSVLAPLAHSLIRTPVRGIRRAGARALRRRRPAVAQERSALVLATARAGRRTDRCGPVYVVVGQGARYPRRRLRGRSQGPAKTARCLISVCSARGPVWPACHRRRTSRSSERPAPAAPSLSSSSRHAVRWISRGSVSVASRAVTQAHRSGSISSNMPGVTRRARTASARWYPE